MKGGNVLVLSHSLISNTHSSSNDFGSSYRESPSVPFPPWKDQPGEAAQGTSEGNAHRKAPAHHPPLPLPPPLQCRPAGMGWDRIGWDGMG